MTCAGFAAERPKPNDDVLDIVGGKTATARHAFSLLRIEGYLTEKSPHALLRPYVPENDFHAAEDDDDDD